VAPRRDANAFADRFASDPNSPRNAVLGDGRRWYCERSQQATRLTLKVGSDLGACSAGALALASKIVTGCVIVALNKPSRSLTTQLGHQRSDSIDVAFVPRSLICWQRAPHLDGLANASEQFEHARYHIAAKLADADICIRSGHRASHSGRNFSPREYPHDRDRYASAYSV
jgi:hypothetical protein